MIVEGKSWNEVDKGKAARVGAFSATSNLAIGGLSNNKFVKEKIGDKFGKKIFGKKSEKAMKILQETEKRATKAKTILLKSAGKEWEERAEKMLLKQKGKMPKAVRDFVFYKTLSKGEDKVCDYVKTFVKEKTYCILT